MAASRRKKRTALRAVLIFVLCLILICAVGAAAFLGLVSRKFKALQTGTTFSFDYQIHTTAEEPPVLYRLLEQFEGTQGTVTGSSSADSLQVSLYPQASRTEPLTRIYISPETTLYDVEQIYSTLRSAIVAEYPLADYLIPQWSLGDYISQTQLAQVLGVDNADTSLAAMTGFQLSWKNLERVQPEQAMDGYLYLRFTAQDAPADEPALILGFAKENLLKTSSPMTHVLLSLPAQQITIELKGAITPAQTVLTAPDSRMQDDDIAVLVQLRETIESVVRFVEQAA